jgi:hypothetical protein
VSDFKKTPELPGFLIGGFDRVLECRCHRYLDGKLVLQGGSKEDRLAAHEWVSLFWHEAVVREG